MRKQELIFHFDHNDIRVKFIKINNKYMLVSINTSNEILFTKEFKRLIDVKTYCQSFIYDTTTPSPETLEFRSDEFGIMPQGEYFYYLFTLKDVVNNLLNGAPTNYLWE